MIREWTAGELLQLSGAYWAGCALQTSVKLDLFTVLAGGPQTEQSLSARLGCDPRALGMLITALSALGFVQRGNGRVSAPEGLLALLSRGSPEYLGFIIKHHSHIMPGWTRLEEVMRRGSAGIGRCVARSPDEGEREDFLMGMFNVARLQAGRIAEALDLKGRNTLLDVGGGPGTYALFFCLANPGLRATVFDLPTTGPVARKTIDRFGLADRVDFVGGDFTTDALPPGQDVVWLSQVLHGESPENAAALVRRAAAVLNPGGLLGIQEFMLDDDKSGPEHAALFSLNMLLQTDGGQAYSSAEIRAMMTDAGVRSIQAPQPDLPDSCRVLVGTMP
jgi:SAM-dependent methyltransferase